MRGLRLLPADLLKTVFTYLPPRELAALALTNETWAERVAPMVLVYIEARQAAAAQVAAAKGFAELVDVLTNLIEGSNPMMEFARMTEDSRWPRRRWIPRRRTERQITLADFANAAFLTEYGWDYDKPFDALDRAKYVAVTLLEQRATFNDIAQLAGATVARLKAATGILELAKSWLDARVLNLHPAFIGFALRYNIHFQRWPLSQLVELGKHILARDHPEEADSLCLCQTFQHHYNKLDILTELKPTRMAANQQFWCEVLCCDVTSEIGAELRAYESPSDAFISHAGSLDFAASMALFDCVAAEEQYYWDMHDVHEAQDIHQYSRAVLLSWLVGKTFTAFSPEEQEDLLSKSTLLPNDLKKSLSDIGFGWVRQCNTLEQAKRISSALHTDLGSEP